MGFRKRELWEWMRDSPFRLEIKGRPFPTRKTGQRGNSKEKRVAWVQGSCESESYYPQQGKEDFKCWEGSIKQLLLLPFGALRKKTLPHGIHLRNVRRPSHSRDGHSCRMTENFLYHLQHCVLLISNLILHKWMGGEYSKLIGLAHGFEVEGRTNLLVNSPAIISECSQMWSSQSFILGTDGWN